MKLGNERALEIRKTLDRRAELLAELKKLPTQRDLARIHNCCQSTIRDIGKNDIYKNADSLGLMAKAARMKLR